MRDAGTAANMRQDLLAEQLNSVLAPAGGLDYVGQW